MFFLSYGEYGPRVVLVQALIRLHNIPIRINGVWDENCMQAIAKYRATLKLPPRGPVDGAVFFQLLQGRKLKVIDTIDASAGWGVELVKAEMKREGIDILLNERIPGRGVENAVTKIVQRAKNHRICLLRMHGHGNGGNWISVALGDPVQLRKSGRMEEYEALKADWQSYIDFSHYERHRPNLSKLTPLFVKFGSVEINSCTVGSKQQKLIDKMAETWGVPVTAGMGIQWALGERSNKWGETVQNTFVMEGDVYTAYPNGGSLSSWARTVEMAIPNLARLYRNAIQMVTGRR